MQAASRPRRTNPAAQGTYDAVADKVAIADADGLLEGEAVTLELVDAIPEAEGDADDDADGAGVAVGEGDTHNGAEPPDQAQPLSEFER